MSKANNGWGNSFYQTMLGYDSYGHTVGLNYKGNGTYRTVTGSVLSIAINIYILYIFVIKGLQFVNRESPNFQKHTIYTDLNKVPEQNLNANEFNFAVGLFSFKEKKYIDIPP